jgi:hypothetical protein
MNKVVVFDEIKMIKQVPTVEASYSYRNNATDGEYVRKQR